MLLESLSAVKLALALYIVMHALAFIIKYTLCNKKLVNLGFIPNYRSPEDSSTSLENKKQWLM